MSIQFQFHPHYISTILGGQSAIDIPALDIGTLDEAYSFIKTYGYNMNDSDDLEQVWKLHRWSVTFIKEEILEEGEEFPADLADPGILNDIAFLLLYASGKEKPHLQKWSCSLLRVMHAYAHVENDLFKNYKNKIADQIIKPVKDHLIKDPIVGLTLGLKSDVDQIRLHKFDIKTIKTKKSSVMKVLNKPHSMAMDILDKMGLRFVTKNKFDAFRVVRFLIREHLICFPNVMPDQSRNTLYPLNFLMEVLESMDSDTSSEELEERLDEVLEYNSARAEYLTKNNKFSSQDYRAIKFISRHLIDIPFEGKSLRFFFPVEIQITDQANYLKNLAGFGAHEEYKARQKAAVRKRILGVD